MILKLSWWHLKDEFTPSKGRHVRHVFDFFSKSSIITYTIPFDFVRLKLWARNQNNNEVVFLESNEELEEGTRIFINLGVLEKYPDAFDISRSDEECGDYYHVKMELEYVETRPIFDQRFSFIQKISKMVKNEDSIDGARLLNDFKDYKISKPFLSGYRALFFVLMPSQPEFSLTIPRGMKLKLKSPRLSVFDLVSGEEDFPENDLNFSATYVSKTDGQEVYNINILPEDWKTHYDIINSQNVLIKIQYAVVNKNKFFFIPSIAVALAIVGIFAVLASYGSLSLDLSTKDPILLVNNTMMINNLFSIALAEIIILLSFSFAYFNLRKSGYELPFNNLITPLILLSALFSIISTSILILSRFF